MFIVFSVIIKNIKELSNIYEPRTEKIRYEKN